MDRLIVALIATVAVVAAACTRGGDEPSAARSVGVSGLPPALRHLQPRAHVDAVRVAHVPVATGGSLGRCLRETPFRSGEVVVVTRIGVVTRSVTVLHSGDPQLVACDKTGVPLERREWCGLSVGILRRGRLPDPRLDILCVDRRRRHIASAWINPAKGARWIGVDQGSVTELYPAAASLPVRVATRRTVDYRRSRATFSITQYAGDGHVIVRTILAARVAG